MSKQKDRKQNTWQNYALRIFIHTASHPLEYAKVLIQIGYEPIPPRPTTTLFGKPALKLPNIFEYVKYIKSVDGFTGCYRGLFPKVCGTVACIFTTEKVLQKLDEQEANAKRKQRPSNRIDQELLGEFSQRGNKQKDAQTKNKADDLDIDEDEHDDDNVDDEEEKDSKQKFLRTLKRDLISRASAIIVCHPFHVITLRMMSQFVGKETKYSGLFSSIAEVYRQNGILGFFSGLIPRIIGDTIFVLVASSLTYGANIYLTDDTEMQMYISATMSLAASAITYPFQLVSNCMAITKSGLAAGKPPRMPDYSSWFECWSDLSRQNQLKRGSSLLVRYYVGPQVVIGGRAVPLLKNESK